MNKKKQKKKRLICKRDICGCQTNNKNNNHDCQNTPKSLLYKERS